MMLRHNETHSKVNHNLGSQSHIRNYGNILSYTPQSEQPSAKQALLKHGRVQIKANKNCILSD